MTYSIKTYPSDGVTTDFNITFDYLDASHVVVSVDKVRTTAVGSNYKFVFNNATNIRVVTVTGELPVPAGKDIKIERETPIDTPAVLFGGGASLTSVNLNKNSEYLTYALQEAADTSEAFTKLYLGSFDIAPTSDNEGEPLQNGTVYYDNVATALFYWTGSEWIIGESTVAAEAFASAAEVSATNAAASEAGVAADAASATASSNTAQASATAAGLSEASAAADRVQTGLDVTATAADRVQTGLDAAATAADLVQTNQDTIDTAANVALTNADVISTNADAAIAAGAVAQTTADAAIAAGAIAQTTADAATAAQAAIDTAADRVQTGLDATTTAADRVQTQLDAASTAADRVQTGLDAASTAADAASTAVDAASTAADRVQTGLDKSATASDRVQTGLDRAAAEASASVAQSAETSALTTAAALTGFDLNAIAESKAVTAVDVFVYDTSKDSDGGAWRKRTQGTSWYNETLDTAIRGSRREFPAVAVIVAEGAKLTIYDGDDPSLPMWMVFTQYSNGFVNNTNSIKSVIALNGKLARADNRGTSVGYGVGVADFIADTMRLYTNSSNTNTVASVGVSGRGSWEFYGTGTSLSDYIVNAYVNDVAMTVLPDAPIDPATGLPVPTIAVATNGGVSVIKDDGTVANGLALGLISGVSFYENKLVSAGHTNNRTWYFTSDVRATVTPFTMTSIPLNASLLGWVGYNTNADPIFVDNSYVARPTNTCLQLAYLKAQSLSESLNAVVSSTYNTGWMNGDIKGAFLSDTDDTDLVGSGELVTNGTFDSDLTGWTQADLVSGGSSTYSIVDQKVRITSTAGNLYGVLGQSFTTDIGALYQVSFGLAPSASDNNGYILRVGTTEAGFDVLNKSSPTDLPSGVTTTVSGTFIATSTTTHITVGNNTLSSSGVYNDFDNISVKLADADRSVNAKPLIVNGTVTRTAVATGAELVAYSGFSASNYLEQPYNADLDFGTGDFCVMWWCYGDTNGTGTPVSCTDSPNTNGFRVDSSGAFLRVLNGGLQANFNSAISYTSGVLRHMAWVISENGTLGILYQDGVMVHSETQTARSIDANTDRLLTVGTRRSGSAAHFNGSIALLRISATAPTAEQIAKIYNDEKFLFQENAQATLYGTSDAVKALAHDSDTNLLHVGTSAGRSVFQGLRRVSNTTTAVGTAISASNGLVVEE